MPSLTKRPSELGYWKMHDMPGSGECLRQKKLIALHRKWSFLLRISSVNVTKSAVSCGFGHIYWRNP